MMTAAVEKGAGGLNKKMTPLGNMMGGEERKENDDFSNRFDFL